MARGNEGRAWDIVDCCSLARAGRPGGCRLLLALTLWSSPRLQEPILPQQSA